MRSLLGDFYIYFGTGLVDVFAVDRQNCMLLALNCGTSDSLCKKKRKIIPFFFLGGGCPIPVLGMKVKQDKSLISFFKTSL